MTEDRRYPHNESATRLIVQEFLSTGTLDQALRVPKIKAAEFEYRIGRWRADLVLFHDDDSISIVEFKGPGSEMEILAAAGQVTLYALQFMREHSPQGKVRRIVTAPVTGSWCAKDVFPILSTMGISFIPLGSVEENEQIWLQAVLTVNTRKSAEESLFDVKSSAGLLSAC